MSAIYTNTAGDKILTNPDKGNAMRFIYKPDSGMIAPHNTGLTVGNKLTLEAWVFPFLGANTSAERRHIFEKGLSFAWGIYEVNRLAIQLWGINGNVQIQSNGTVPVKTKTHLAITWDGDIGTLNFLMNGIIDRTVTSATYQGNYDKPTTGQINSFIGGFQSNGGRRFDGLLDEVRVWNVAKTAEEIQARMYEVITPQTADRANLVACYGFDENNGVGTSAIAYDASPIANHTTSGSYNVTNWRVGSPFDFPVTGKKIIRK